MSARAAARLESLGFAEVYEYRAGKVDWFAAGLPMEGRHANSCRAGHLARRDDVTCQLAESVADVVERAGRADKEVAIVVNNDNIVLGRVHVAQVTAEDDTRVEDVMEAGPITTRPDASLESVAQWLKERNLPSILVTTSDGKLVGTLHREDIEKHLAGEPIAKAEAEQEDCCDCKG